MREYVFLGTFLEWENFAGACSLHPWAASSERTVVNEGMSGPKSKTYFEALLLLSLLPC